MNNPFESGQIKNYILFYAAVVVIMVLFFIATTLFHDAAAIEKKSVEKEHVLKQIPKEQEELKDDEVKKPFEGEFRLLERAY